MAFDATADLSAMFFDFGVTVVFGATSVGRTVGHVDTVPQDGASAGSIGYDSQERAVTVRTSYLTANPTLVEDAALTVNGVAYVVRRTAPVDDGALSVIVLAPA